MHQPAIATHKQPGLFNQRTGLQQAQASYLAAQMQLFELLLQQGLRRGLSVVRADQDHVLQADEGADMDFLVGQRGSAVPKDNH